MRQACRSPVALLLTAILVVAACSDEAGGTGGTGGVGGSDGPTETRPADPRSQPASLADAATVFWVDRDREQANRLGDEAAIDSLFSATPEADDYEVVSCNDAQGRPGARSCLVTGGTQSMVFTAARESERRWRIVAVTHIR